MRQTRVHADLKHQIMASFNEDGTSGFIQTSPAWAALQSAIEKVQPNLKQFKLENKLSGALNTIGAPDNLEEILKELKNHHPEVDNDLHGFTRGLLNLCIGVRNQAPAHGVCYSKG
jgi:hypothetical protein